MPLPPEFSRVQVHVGVSGSGKTYRAQRLAERAAQLGAKVLVIDIHREFTKEGRLPMAVVSEPAHCDKAVAAGHRFLVAQPAEFLGLAHARLIEWGLRSRDTLFVITEAHRYWPSHARPGVALDAPSAELLTAYRHFGCGLIADTQRAAALSKTATEQASILRVFATVGRRDLDVLDDYARGLAQAATDAAGRLARGEAGWHVCVDTRTRMGPFTLTRGE